MKTLKLKTQTAATLLTTLIILSGCSSSFLNSLTQPLVYPSNSPQVFPTAGVTSTALDSYTISNVNIAAPSSGTTSTTGSLNTTIFFDTALSPTPIINHCTLPASGGASSATTSKVCMCKFSWSEVNPNSTTSSTTPRTVQTALSVVQPNLLVCPAPGVYSNEILDGTQLKVQIVPGPSNPDAASFNVKPFIYTKSSTVVTGSFQDAQGHQFDNILHYSCYQKLKRGMSIQNKIYLATNSTTGETANSPIATQFCIAKAGGGGGSGSGCDNLPQPDYSAQANYFNLFIRNSEQGDINQFNDNFICPQVAETLQNGNSVGSMNKAWPLDSTFALSLSPTTVFSVGVVANTKLSNGTQDPVTSASACFSASGTDPSSSPSGSPGGSTSGSTGSVGSSGNSTNIISSCLGFAARVNSDGSCPNFKDARGLLRPTFRLRRYISIYPRMFDTDGNTIQGQGQSIDTIYVLDRPVRVPAGTSPLQSFTMLGPKPCPFAYFDRAAVTGKSSYYGTNNAAWSGRNVDGIEFPNLDSVPGTSSVLSCSAALPILSKDGSYFSIQTVNYFSPKSYLRHVYVRPTQPFSPHFEEDTDFQACAPQSSPLRDPPLHFSRSTDGNVAWCAESYPTQNPYISSIDPANPVTFIPKGDISPYTSHVVKNSISHTCASTLINIPESNTYKYGAGSNLQYAKHLYSSSWPPGNTLGTTAQMTCDRTTVDQGLAWPRFPLLAPEGDVEKAIAADKSYYCSVTYDNGGSKSLNLTTPTDGCCNSSIVNVITGTVGPTSAHLEPDSLCSIPNY